MKIDRFYVSPLLSFSISDLVCFGCCIVDLFGSDVIVMVFESFRSLMTVKPVDLEDLDL